MADLTNQGSGGASGQSKGRVSETFQKRLSELQSQAENLYLADRLQAQPQWQVPAELTDSQLIDPTLMLTAPPDDDDPDEVRIPAYDRDDLNNLYEEIVAAKGGIPGTLGDVVATKMQVDYLGMQERAMRIRHVTLPRAFALATARQLGQARGPIFTSNSGGIVSAISNYIAAGSPDSGTAQ